MVDWMLARLKGWPLEVAVSALGDDAIMFEVATADGSGLRATLPIPPEGVDDPHIWAGALFGELVVGRALQRMRRPRSEVK